ncbi:MAG: hypothetical protein E6238_08300 [Streptococcus sp.]|jgi:hypothetical protein|uniref:hypothetical protein n=1 Tax=Streptococcus sp. TaxID=1306 RepID=UPI00290AEE9D|nr:hypothetical protein [Streptococcus sp.]MDU5072883.1 hypothetical protein [Streptococcus sp.]
MFLKLDTLLSEEDYHLTDEEVIKAFKNLGYVLQEEETRKNLDILCEFIHSKETEVGSSIFSLPNFSESSSLTLKQDIETSSLYEVNINDLFKKFAKFEEPYQKLQGNNKVYITNTTTESTESNSIVNTLNETLVA